MNLRALRQFVTTAEEGNFHRAAKRLGVSQPAITASISTLEQSLGFDLFVREFGGQVSLTAAGSAYLSVAQRSVFNLDRIQRNARGAWEKESLVRLGFCESVTSPRSMYLFQDLREHMPECEFEVLQLLSQDVCDALVRREIDVGVTLSNVSYPGLEAQTLWNEGWMVTLPAGHRLAKKTLLTPVDLAPEPLILGNSQIGTGAYHRIRRCFETSDIEPISIIEVETRSTMLGLCAAGLGITFMPESLAELELPEFVMIPFRGAKTSVVVVFDPKSLSAPSSLAVDLLQRLNSKPRRQRGPAADSRSLRRK